MNIQEQRVDSLMEELSQRLESLLEKEISDAYAVTRDYLADSECSITERIRHRVVEWMYRFVDHFGKGC